MATRTTPITQTYVTPYITVAEFKAAATGVDVSALVAGGSQAAQDAELVNVINRASSFVDTYCSSSLAAQSQVETGRTRFTREGTLRIHPQNTPILQVTSLTWGTLPNAQTGAVDPVNLWIEDQMIVAPLAGAGSWTGNLFQFGVSGYPGGQVYYTLSYVSGYPLSTVTSAVAAGQTTLPVADRTGFIGGMGVTIFDGQNTEQALIATSYVGATGAGSLTLASATVNAHGLLAAVSALPPAVKEAAILLTSALIKQRGSGSITMQGIEPGGTVGTWGAGESDKCLAYEMLKPFRNPY